MNMNNSLRGCRPYPIDKDRQNRCMSVLNDAGMTITELAEYIGMDRGNLSKIISGRELTESGETKIARFLGYQYNDPQFLEGRQPEKTRFSSKIWKSCYNENYE